MQVSGSQGNGAGILDLEVQLFGGGQDAIVGWRVGESVADDLTDLDRAGLVEEQHFTGSALIGFALLVGVGALEEGQVVEAATIVVAGVA